MPDEVNHYALDDRGRPGNGNLPEVTLSAYDESGRAESVPVLRQQAYTGRVLPSSVANTPCIDLGVDGMLKKLNLPVCTSESHLYKTYKEFVSGNCDLGTAYAYLRPHLHDIIENKHVSDSKEALEDDRAMRQKMLVNRKILDGDVPPRRVWDLHANRVVPWWVARKVPWAISHAWVKEMDLRRRTTPINGYEWPVPMPKDADLNLIRIEMLNLGAEYIWLDVLCLRQKVPGDDPGDKPNEEEYGRREALRQEEWKVDLPTIGWIYHKANRVVYYFSGLGLPLSFKSGDFDNERCWFNRGWTLQEIRDNFFIAGEAHYGGGGMLMEQDKKKRPKFRNCNLIKRLWRSKASKRIIDDQLIPAESNSADMFLTVNMRRQLEKKLASLRQMQRQESIFHVLSHMQKRKSTNPVDKVAGLIYLFYSQYIPIYDANQSAEDAWTELVSVTQDWFRADLFFLYPGPGNGNKFWHPSWEQVMTEVLPKSSLNKDLYTIKVFRTREDGDKYYGLRISSCTVEGLGTISAPTMPRHGKLHLKNYTFNIVAYHTYLIPDGKYTLIGTAKHASTMEGVIWVVGKKDRLRIPKKFRKVSVFSMANKQQEEGLWSINAHKVTETLLL